MGFRDSLSHQLLRRWSRRDVLLFGMGAIASVVGGGSLLPQTTLERLGIIHGNKNWPKEEWLLNKALRIDDDVAEALYSTNRLGANLHQIADYPAQEQLQRSYSRPQLYSRMAFDSRRARCRLKRFFEYPEPARVLPDA